MGRLRTEVRGLTVARREGTFFAEFLRGVDFDFERGVPHAVLGESGSGKTVVLHSIAGILRKPWEVKRNIFRVDGEGGRVDVTEKALDYFASVFQHGTATFDPVVRLRRQYESQRKSEVGGVYVPEGKEVAEMLGLPEGFLEMFPHQLSVGTAARADVAFAIKRGTPFTLIDEPTAALDESTTEMVSETLRRTAERGGTTPVFVTHDVGFARETAEVVTILYRGTVVETGPAGKVLTDPGHPYTEALVRAYGSSKKGERPPYILGGKAPALTDEVKGCPFEGRCTERVTECGEGLPEMRGEATWKKRCTR